MSYPGLRGFSLVVIVADVPPASRCDVSLTPGVLERLLERYAAEGRPYRSCEPRDLIERGRDICHYQNLPMKLNDEIIDLAWKGLFGSRY